MLKNHLLTALKFVVFGYILAAPMIHHDSSCALNTTEFHIAILILSGAITIVDTTLGVLMIVASLIVIGSFNYDFSRKSVVSPSVSVTSAPPPGDPVANVAEEGEDPERVTYPKSMDTHVPPAGDRTGGGPVVHVSPVDTGSRAGHTPAPAGAPVNDGGGVAAQFCGSTRETYEPLDFLKNSALNPGGFVTEESLARVQTNTVSPGSLNNVYSPLAGKLGTEVYTAQGVLPGSGVRAAR